jgi:hypothetical protein
MRLRGGGAAPCSPCNTRAALLELRTMRVYYQKKDFYLLGFIIPILPLFFMITFFLAFLSGII